MAKFMFSGLEEYSLKLSRLGSGSEEIAGKAIYAGAAIIADAVRESIEALPVIPNVHGTEENKIDGVTATQKAGLLEGFGITPLNEENGYYNVKLGFDGYNSMKTKQYPNGQPNVLIARSLESGTSFRKKNQFVTRAVRATRSRAEAKMKQVVDEEIEKIMK